MRLYSFLTLLGIVVMLAGCAVVDEGPKVKYVENGTMIAGRADTLTVYDLDATVQELMTKMRKSNLFAKKYKEAVERKGEGVPVLVLGEIKNFTELRIVDRLLSARDVARVTLYEMDMFEIKDDSVAKELADRIIRSGNGPLENNSLVQVLGEHDAPDFYFTGSIRSFVDDGYNTYRLSLQLHDLTTGKIVWEGLQTKIKL